MAAALSLPCVYWALLELLIQQLCLPQNPVLRETLLERLGVLGAPQAVVSAFLA